LDNGKVIGDTVYKEEATTEAGYAGPPVWTWSDDVRLTSDASNSRDSNIASNGDYVHVVWADERDGNYEIYYKRSIDGGVTWGDNIRLTIADHTSYRPYLAVSGSNVYVVWEDVRDLNYRIYFKKSADNGATWGDDTLLSDTGDLQSWYTSIAASNDYVYVFWEDNRNGNSEIYYKISTDNGVTWGDDTRLTTTDLRSTLPIVAASGDNVHVVWQDERDLEDYFEIYYKKSSNNGATWGDEVRFTNNISINENAFIRADGNNVHIIWYETNFDIYYKRSTDNGDTWSDTEGLVVSGTYSITPRFAVNGDNIYLVWEDNKDNDEFDFDIHYMKSADGGVTWGDDTRLTTAASVFIVFPFIAVSNDNVHITWTDERDGNYEIYYKRGYYD